MKPTGPCLNCEEREENCHRGCKQYIRYRKQLDKYNDEIKKQQLFERDYYSALRCKK